MKRLLAIALLWLIGAPVAALAEDVGNTPQVTLDPAKAYVMYAGNHLGQTLTLISIATREEQEAYHQHRATALAEAKRQYPTALADWNARAAAVKPGGRPPADKPVEPTEDNFSFPLPVTVVQIGLGNHPFARNNERTVYLASLPPGDYYVADAPYGMFYNVPETCLCLGTVRFHVAAGQITNMGLIVSNYYELLMRARANGTPKPRTHFDFPEGMTSMSIEPAPAGAPVDPRLGTFPVVPAAYRPFGKFPNTSHYFVDRLTAMPGVFRYERDRMIDLTTGTGR